MSDTSRQFEKAGHPDKTDAKTNSENRWAEIARDALLGAAFPAALAAEKAGEYAANHPDQVQKACNWVKDEVQSLWKDYSSGVNLGTLLFPEPLLVNELMKEAKSHDQHSGR